MKKSQTRQNTKLNCQSCIYDIEEVNGILYFTVDLGQKGKQRWKNNGINSVFVAHILED